MSDAFALGISLLRRLPPELAHRLAISALRMRQRRMEPTSDDPVLRMQIWGRLFPNPIGMAAGFDKDAEVYDADLASRLRLSLKSAVSRRSRSRATPSRACSGCRKMVLSSTEWASTAAVCRGRASIWRSGDIIGTASSGSISARTRLVMQSKTIVGGVRELAAYADYLVLNVSSPNTPGLRALQSADALRTLVAACSEPRCAAAVSLRAIRRRCC